MHCCIYLCIQSKTEIEERLKSMEEQNKILDKDNMEKDLIIAEMKEETNCLYKERQALVIQWHKGMNTLILQKKKLNDISILNSQLAEEKRLLAEEKKSVVEQNNLLAKQLKESRNTVKEMGMWWLIRVLSPSHIAVDFWFFAFTFSYLYFKA